MSIIFQPFAERLGDKLINCLKSDFKSFQFVVAYARKSGTGLLFPYMNAFRTNGGVIIGCVGIDQENTSIEAVDMLIDVSNELYVYYNENPQSTFHPKMYLFSNEKKAVLFIGSNNFTKGGLYQNYELAYCVEYDLSNPSDIAEYNKAKEIVAQYINTEGSFSRHILKDGLQQLIDNKYIFSELHININRQSSLKRDATKGERTKLFGTKTFTSPLIELPTSSKEEVELKTTPDASYAKGFYKRLSANDVSATSSPGQIIIPIGFKYYFEPFQNPQPTKAGAIQSERYLNILFRTNGRTDMVAENARIILYEPAPTHPRQNKELRFAFRDDRQIIKLLSEGDILVFEPSNDHVYNFIITSISKSSPEAIKFENSFGYL